MDGGLYRLAFVPVATSAPGAWLCAGFAIDDRRVADVRRRTGLQVSVLRASIPDSSFMRPRSRVSSGTISSERSPHRGQPSSFVLTGAFWLRPK
jgi:hypothetical protein